MEQLPPTDNVPASSDGDSIGISSSVARIPVQSSMYQKKRSAITKQRNRHV
jgi:hypothetical protein